MNAFLWRTRLSYIPPWQELLLDLDQAHLDVLNDIQNLTFSTQTFHPAILLLRPISYLLLHLPFISPA